MLHRTCPQGRILHPLNKSSWATAPLLQSAGQGTLCQCHHHHHHQNPSDVVLRRQLKIPSVESQIRRARLRYAASLVKVAQPSVAVLLGVGQRAPADWASLLLGDLESLREVCPLFQNLDDPSTDWERWRALIATPVGDRAIRLSLKFESCWYETPSIYTVDMSNTCDADLPRNVLLCPECPSECVRVFTSERARQAHRARVHGQRAMARVFVIDERCPACVAKHLARVQWQLSICNAMHRDVGA